MQGRVICEKTRHTSTRCFLRTIHLKGTRWTLSDRSARTNHASDSQETKRKRGSGDRREHPKDAGAATIQMLLRQASDVARAEWLSSPSPRPGVVRAPHATARLCFIEAGAFFLGRGKKGARLLSQRQHSCDGCVDSAICTYRTTVPPRLRFASTEV